MKNTSTPWASPTRLLHRLSWSVLTAMALAPVVASATTFAKKRIEIVVPGPAGATTDILARMIAERLAPKVGHAVIVVNKAGANQQIGADFVSRADGDGHTLLLAHSALVANPLMFSAIKMDMNKDLTPIMQLVSTPWVFAVPEALPVNDVKEFIAFAKAHPAKVNFGSTGGTVTLDTTVFMARAGIRAEIVNYAGGAPLLTALATNEVQAGLHSVRSVGSMKGKVKALAVTSARRSPLAPELPTIDESGLPGFSGSPLWFGLWGPASMPTELARQINAELKTILAAPDVKKRIEEGMSCDVVAGSPDEFRQAITAELEHYKRAAQSAKLVPQ